MGILDYVEYCLSWLFFNFKGRDAKVFTKGPAFADFPKPTIEVTSPDCGPSGSDMKPEYTQVGADRFPELHWSNPPGDVKEYILICEDPDAPLPTPIYHSLFYAIPPHSMKITAGDIELVAVEGKEERSPKGGFRFVKNRRGKHYAGPKPLLGHGPHRYFYQLIALNEPLDLVELGENVTKEQLAEAIVGKVVGWGIWIGSFERKWE